jgi:F-type H+-transporting ATPase subunit delta
MVTGSLARRYAKAIVQIGEQYKNLDKIGADLEALSNAMKSSAELVDVLSNPAVRRADRRKVLDALLVRLAAQDATKHIVHLLLDHERLGSLPAIVREVTAMIEAKAGRVTAEVTSATDLSPAQLTQLQQTLEKLSGKKVTIEKKKDPTLLGGVVAKVGDVVYDGSVRTQLRALRDELGK